MTKFQLRKLLSISLLIVGLLVITHLKYHNEVIDSTKQDLRKVQSYILRSEANAIKTISDPLFKADFEQSDIVFNDFRKENDFTILVYQQDELSYWSSNNLSLPTNTSSLREGSNLVRLKNYWADIYKVSKEKDNYILFIIPIKFIYDIRNAYLVNHFAVENIANDLTVSNQDTNDYRSLHGESGDFLFSLLPITDTMVIPQNLFFVFIDFLIYFLLFYLLYSIAVLLHQTYSLMGSLSFLVLSLLCLRFLFFSINFLPYLQSTIPFDPAYFASSIFLPSLGIMGINLSIILLLVYYVFKNVKKEIFKSAKLFSAVLILIFYLLIYFLQIPIFKTIQSLVIDSVISFELNNLFSLDYVSFLSFFLIFLLLLIYYFISVKLFRFSLSLFKGRT